jgi:hypothetical protein
MFKTFCKKQTLQICFQLNRPLEAQPYFDGARMDRFCNTKVVQNHHSDAGSSLMQFGSSKDISRIFFHGNDHGAEIRGEIRELWSCMFPSGICGISAPV